MKTYKILGMMSGTSLDGLDMAFCHFWKERGQWKFSIEKTGEIPYGVQMYGQLKNAILLSDEEHGKLHQEYGIWLGKKAKKFIKEKKLEVDFIASHGHTSHHRPEDGVTFQLGDGQFLANTSGYRVICDFRIKDVSLGGQGAPLVPIGDLLLFHDYDFCLNLGGISNMTFEKDGNCIAYDIGLANMPLNYITQKIDLDYDQNGKLARTGSVDVDILNTLNSLEYYRKPYPKSTGYEWFLDEIVPLIEESNSPEANLLHTFIHHNCEQISIEVKKHVTKPKSRLMVTGGGALNSFFTDTLQEKLGPTVELVLPSKTLIAFKEAMVFAFMGALRSENQINVLSSVTGARRDSCSGEVFVPGL